MRHKLNTFILKNPPEEKVSKAEKRCAFLSVHFRPLHHFSRRLCTAAELKVKNKTRLRLVHRRS